MYSFISRPPENLISIAGFTDPTRSIMASYFQVEKVHYVEALGSRVNMIEAERQQSEARVKEEVDASLGQKMGAIDQVGEGEVGSVKEDRWVGIGKWV